MRIEEIAARARYEQVWITPYDTGNLAYSVGDIFSVSENSCSYVPFNANSRAEYGAVLNDNPVIRFERIVDGRTQVRTYANKHYRWFDNFIENFAVKIASEIGATLE